MKEFCDKNAIKHLTCAPETPYSNGLAERHVQTAKANLKKLKGPLKERIARFLMNYRNSISSNTGMSPAKLMLGRRIRSRLDLYKPNSVSKEVRERLESKGQISPENSLQPVFKIGDNVWAREFRNKQVKWFSSVVVKQLGNVMYEVRREGLNTVERRHMNQLRHRLTDDSPEGLLRTLGGSEHRSEQVTHPIPEIVPTGPAVSLALPDRFA